MMLRAYTLLAWCAAGPLLAYLWWRGRKDADYRLRWRERFGHVGATDRLRNGVVLHCASVGEVIAARTLVEQLLADPRWGPVLLTCSTPTGARQIRRDFGTRVGHMYFPLDLPRATGRFLDALQPRLVLLFEREVWPVFLHQAQRRGVPVALVNARLSERSARGYLRSAGLMAPALASLRLVCAEDDAARARFAALGVRAERLCVTGNIKSDVQVTSELRRQIGTLRAACGARPVLTAGSTHAGEDEALVQAFMRHLQTAPDTLLILVPRHPERFDPVAALLQRHGLRFVRRSLAQEPTADTQVLLGDSMGELMLWYGVADVCFVGGSLIPRGGHNPLEVLCLDKPLLTGAHTANFDAVYQELESAGALGRVADAEAVFAQFRLLLDTPTLSLERVARGRVIHERRSGAVARTVAALEHLTRDFAPGGAGSACVTVGDGVECVWADPTFFAPTLFDLGWWRGRGTVEALGAGRGNIHVVGDGQRSFLLRHYYRGGLMARVSRDLFLAQPVAASRAMQEFTLLRTLRARGLAVPLACAARYSRVGLFWYRADILVQRIPDAVDVARLLHHHRALADNEWQLLGRAVRALHDAQVFHSDLNCHNLMLDGQGQAWIVDFDKCGFRAGEAWKTANLERLLRSLRKELRLDPQLRWDETQWPQFLAGYTAAPTCTT